MNYIAMIFPSIGMPEILIICLALCLLFGAKSLPKFARGIKEAIWEFKKIKEPIEETLNEVQETVKKEVNDIKKEVRKL